MLALPGGQAPSRAASRSRSAPRPGTRWFEGAVSDQLYREGQLGRGISASATRSCPESTLGEPHYWPPQAASVRAADRTLSWRRNSARSRDIERALDARPAPSPIHSSGMTRPRSRRMSFLVRRSPCGPRRLPPSSSSCFGVNGELQFSVIALPAFAAAAHRLGVAESAPGDAVAERGLEALVPVAPRIWRRATTAQPPTCCSRDRLAPRRGGGTALAAGRCRRGNTRPQQLERASRSSGVAPRGSSPQRRSRELPRLSVQAVRCAPPEKWPSG